MDNQDPMDLGDLKVIEDLMVYPEIPVFLEILD